MPCESQAAGMRRATTGHKRGGVISTGKIAKDQKAFEMKGAKPEVFVSNEMARLLAAARNWCSTSV